MADNIVHLVLARLPDAPPGTRGISLFLVPKFLVKPDGSLGPRNDLRCASIEHKLGIHASPTCVMVYGDEGGAIAYLVGEENRGLAAMFVMMNAARLGVGLQGVAIGERAYQQALAYARERRQGRAGADGRRHEPDRRASRRAAHAVTMKALVQAARGICHLTAMSIDLATHADSAESARGGGRARRAADAGRQGVLDRRRRRGRLARRAGARRHGLHRGDRRGAILARCPHRRDLRGHQRHPGDRPRPAQAAAVGRRDAEARDRRDARGRRRSGGVGRSGIRRDRGAARRSGRRARAGERLSRRRARRRRRLGARRRDALSAAVRPRARRRLPRQGGPRRVEPAGRTRPHRPRPLLRREARDRGARPRAIRFSPAPRRSTAAKRSSRRAHERIRQSPARRRGPRRHVGAAGKEERADRRDVRGADRRLRRGERRRSASARC